MRKLAIACGAFSAAIFLANYILPAAWLLPLALVLWLAGTALVLLRRRWLLPLILTLCAAAFGLFAFRLHDARTLEHARAIDGSQRRGTAVVLSSPELRESYASAEVRLDIGDGTKLRARLYDRSGALSAAAPGDSVRGGFRVWAADLRYGDRYDNEIADGILLRANNEGELALVPAAGVRLSALPARINAAIRARVGKLFPADTEGFFRALMLGDKSGLYQDDERYLAMSRAGLMHTVAVSGMHISVLVGLLMKLLGRRRRSALLCLAIAWSFVLISGAPPSAVRAAVMQSVLLLAPVFGRENDPPTGLLFALALILLANPRAAGSVSLQLSFSAVAGILLFSDRLRNTVSSCLPRLLPYRLKNYLSSVTAVSLSVLVFSVPLSGLYFGSVSTLSPLTNLLALWAVPYCFGGGFFCCLLSLASKPAGMLAARAVSWLARYVLLVARGISSLGFSCLYLCLRANVIWLAFVYLLLIAAALIPGARWKKWVYPAGLAVFSLFALLTATRLFYASPKGFVTAVDVGQGQSLVAMADSRTVVIDCGNVNSLSGAGDSTGAYLRSRGRERIDLLVLTHLHRDHVDGAVRLMAFIPVDRLLICADAADSAELRAIVHAARRHGTQIEFVSRDETLRIGGIRLELYAPSGAGDGNESCLTGKLGIGDYDVLVTSDIGAEQERELLRSHGLSGIELLIVSHHGSRYGSCYELLRGIGASRAVISCGCNSYGHPAEETLERLAECGYTVDRTDRDGTVEIRIR